MIRKLINLKFILQIRETIKYLFEPQIRTCIKFKKKFEEKTKRTGKLILGSYFGIQRYIRIRYDFKLKMSV